MEGSYLWHEFPLHMTCNRTEKKPVETKNHEHEFNSQPLMGSGDKCDAQADMKEWA